eukprot:COSAG06_NODE_10735_length_1627_cov_1.443063_2_plen_104_part_00
MVVWHGRFENGMQVVHGRATDLNLRFVTQVRGTRRHHKPCIVKTHKHKISDLEATRSRAARPAPRFEAAPPPPRAPTPSAPQAAGGAAGRGARRGPSDGAAPH